MFEVSEYCVFAHKIGAKNIIWRGEAKSAEEAKLKARAFGTGWYEEKDLVVGGVYNPLKTQVPVEPMEPKPQEKTISSVKIKRVDAQDFRTYKAARDEAERLHVDLEFVD